MSQRSFRMGIREIADGIVKLTCGHTRLLRDFPKLCVTDKARCVVCAKKHKERNPVRPDDGYMTEADYQTWWRL